LDPLLAGITQTAVSILDDTYTVQVMGNYIFMCVSTLLITILGTILTDKVFSAHSSTGKVSVPATAAGGRCEAETSTGDIRLSISGK
ncbi:MAG: AbgT family transporter, partial [Clostridia bacterium]|nr:AbgT family transporter [Clostridia bacterium]